MALELSVVIPAYNEHELLPRLLATLDIARSRYRGGGAAIEVIVADNDSSDDTADIAQRAGCRVVRTAKRCIAAARNGGAAAAAAKVLCFVDADSIVHPETFNVIAEGFGDRAIAGTTGVHPERWSLGLRVTFAAMLPVIWATNIDAGVVFCRRADFEAIGGYNEDRQFAEDVEFLLALRSLGRRRSPRQRLVRLKGAKTLTSTRKYDKHGEWHFLVEAARHAVLMHLRPSATAAFAQQYWYDDR
jgi:glycosyltransferase involved in cell wall biosynthesis